MNIANMYRILEQKGLTRQEADDVIAEEEEIRRIARQETEHEADRETEHEAQ